MADALAFVGVIQSFQAMTNIGKSLIGIYDASIIKEKVIELNGESFPLNRAHSRPKRINLRCCNKGVLEKQIAQLEAWETEAQTYQLRDVSRPGRTGQFAFAPKPDTHIGEPTHLICAKCYNERHKSFLQHEKRQPGACDVLACHDCGSDLYLTGERDPYHVQTKSVSRRK